MNLPSRHLFIASLFSFAVFLFSVNIGISHAQGAENLQFFIDPSYDLAGRSEVAASLLIDGQSAYYYIENIYWNKLDTESKNLLVNNITSLSNEFDASIYPAMRQFYGTEWTPGIDSDPKIYIFLTNIINDTGGYYNPNNEYLKNQVVDGRSNEKEIIYLNVNFADKTSIKPFLAHEFQHMINWYQKKVLSTVNEDIWLNEALSEYTYTLLGYDNPFPQSVTASRAKTFLEDPSDSLTEWRNSGTDYAAVNMFAQFLVDRYSKNIIKSIITSKKTGIDAINDALQRSGFVATFDDVFSDWIIASYLNNKTVLDGKYAYLNQNLSYNAFHATPTEIMSIRPNITVSGLEYTKDWSGNWFEFTPMGINSASKQVLKISFAAEKTESNFKIPYLVKNTDGTMNVGVLILDSQGKGNAYVNDFGTAASSVILMPISRKNRGPFTDSEPLTKFSYEVSLIQANVPAIKSITPANSNVSGGSLATIVGDNFTSNTIVKIGNTSADIVSMPDSKTIIVKIPPSSQTGPVSLEITNLNLFSIVIPQYFTYSIPINDGSLIRANGDFKVYVVNGKFKRWIQSPKIFNMYGLKWENILNVDLQTRDYYEESRLVRADGDYKVYEIDANNIKHHLDITGEKFSASGRSWEAIFMINTLEKNLYKTGTPILN